MRVQIAAKVFVQDQGGQGALGRELDLAPSFAQFGRDPGAADRGVYRFLRLAGDPRAIVLEHAVLVDLELAHLQRPAAQLDVVGL